VAKVFKLKQKKKSSREEFCTTFASSIFPCGGADGAKVGLNDLNHEPYLILIAEVEFADRLTEGRVGGKFMYYFQQTIKHMSYTNIVLT